MQSRKSNKAKKNAKPSLAQRQAQSNRDRATKPKNGGSTLAPMTAKVQAAPVSISEIQVGRPPRITYAANGSSCKVAHRERIGTILGSIAFAVNTFAVNPGLAASFPWLSALAQRFESYRFNRLTYQYRTKTATTALGDVVLTLDYDAADAAPVTSIQAEGYAEFSSAAPWQDINHNSKLINLRKLPMYYVRTEALAANQDIKTYDVGNMFYCTENQSSANLVGYAYVEYEVEFFTPQLNSDISGIQYGGKIVGATTMTGANPLGIAPVVDAQSNGISVDATSTITFAVPGTYIVSTTLTGTVLSNTILTNVSGTAVTEVGDAANAAATSMVASYTVVTSIANATAQLTATATTVTASVVLIGRAPTNSTA